MIFGAPCQAIAHILSALDEVYFMLGAGTTNLHRIPTIQQTDRSSSNSPMLLKFARCGGRRAGVASLAAISRLGGDRSGSASLFRQASQVLCKSCEEHFVARATHAAQP